jgi:hypothetical protein
MEESFNLRNSRACRCAAEIEANGCSFVPGLVSLPVGDTQISLADKDDTTKTSRSKQIDLQSLATIFYQYYWSVIYIFQHSTSVFSL